MDDDHVRVSLGLLFSSGNFLQDYENFKPFQNKDDFLGSIEEIKNDLRAFETGDDIIKLNDLEILNRNEFFAQRYGARTNVKKMSIVFYGEDKLQVSIYFFLLLEQKHSHFCGF